MAVNKVDLYVSQILEDLDNGLTWLKRDDVGYGSIQDKYNAKDQQIIMIRKHPKLKDAETNVTVFNIIDDTKEEKANLTSQTANSVVETKTETTEAVVSSPVNQTEVVSAQPAVSEDFSAFVNL